MSAKSLALLFVFGACSFCAGREPPGASTAERIVDTRLHLVDLIGDDIQSDDYERKFIGCFKDTLRQLDPKKPFPKDPTITSCMLYRRRDDKMRLLVLWISADSEIKWIRLSDGRQSVVIRLPVSNVYLTENRSEQKISVLGRYLDAFDETTLSYDVLKPLLDSDRPLFATIEVADKPSGNAVQVVRSR